MADNYLEKHYADYEKKKEKWKRLHNCCNRKVKAMLTSKEMD